MKKCKVCKKTIKQSGPGRPRKTHARCKGSSRLKKAGKKKKAGKVRRYSSGSRTKSQRGRALAGTGTGWRNFWHGGRTGATKHDKTWAAKIAKKGSGWTVVTRHGRRTGQKNETVRGVMSKDKAMMTLLRLIRQKLNKGYMYVGSKRGH